MIPIEAMFVVLPEAGVVVAEGTRIHEVRKSLFRFRCKRGISQGFGLGADDSYSRGGRRTSSRGRRGRGGPQIHPDAWTPHRGRRGFLRGIGFDVPNTERPVPNFIPGNDPGRIKIDLRNRPLLRPVIFVRSATVLFENEDEIFQPEIVENGIVLFVTLGPVLELMLIVMQK